MVNIFFEITINKERLDVLCVMAKTEKGGVIVEFYFSFLVLNYCSLNFKRNKL